MCHCRNRPQRVYAQMPYFRANGSHVGARMTARNFQKASRAISVPRTKAPLIERIMRRVIKHADSGCWEWVGATTQGGYAHILEGGRGSENLTVHRYLFELRFGKVPNELDLDHLCHNRQCVNPEHLEPVTRSENLRRGDNAKVRREFGMSRTHCAHGHELSPDNVLFVRKYKRACRTCNRERMRIRRGTPTENYRK